MKKQARVGEKDTMGRIGISYQEVANAAERLQGLERNPTVDSIRELYRQQIHDCALSEGLESPQWTSMGHHWDPARSAGFGQRVVGAITNQR